MKHKHNILFILLFTSLTLSIYFFGGKISEAVTQNLITFFSIAFGFYMTTIALIFGSSYAHNLYQAITIDGEKREIHVLKIYFKIASYWSLFSIVIILILMVFGKKNNDGYLSFDFDFSHFTLITSYIDLNLLWNALILAISSLNVFFMLLIIHQVFEALIHNIQIELSKK